MRQSRRGGGVLLAFVCTGCGYHTAGHTVTIPDNVRTIAIPAFVNQTQTFKIEQMLTAAVVKRVRHANPLPHHQPGQ